MTGLISSVLLLGTLAVLGASCSGAETDTVASNGAPVVESDGFERKQPPRASQKSNDPLPVVGTVIRFSSETGFVDVTIGQNSTTTRALLMSLPLTLEVQEFGGREKIAYLPSRLPTDGVADSKPDDGDLIYYAPWGNLGFYYDAAGVGHNDDVIHVGTFLASIDELASLEDTPVRVAVIG